MTLATGLDAKGRPILAPTLRPPLKVSGFESAPVAEILPNVEPVDVKDNEESMATSQSSFCTGTDAPVYQSAASAKSPDHNKINEPVKA